MSNNQTRPPIINVGTMRETHNGCTYEFMMVVDQPENWDLMSRAAQSQFNAESARDIRIRAELKAQEDAAKSQRTLEDRIEKPDPFGKIADRMSKLAGLD